MFFNSRRLLSASTMWEIRNMSAIFYFKKDMNKITTTKALSQLLWVARTLFIHSILLRSLLCKLTTITSLFVASNHVC